MDRVHDVSNVFHIAVSHSFDAFVIHGVSKCVTIKRQNIDMGLRIELIKFYDYLGDNSVLKDDERGKAFRWIDNFINSASHETRSISKNEVSKELCNCKKPQPDYAWIVCEKCGNLLS